MNRDFFLKKMKNKNSKTYKSHKIKPQGYPVSKKDLQLVRSCNYCNKYDHLSKDCQLISSRNKKLISRQSDISSVTESDDDYLDASESDNDYSDASDYSEDSNDKYICVRKNKIVKTVTCQMCSEKGHVGINCPNLRSRLGLVNINNININVNVNYNYK